LWMKLWINIASKERPLSEFREIWEQIEKFQRIQ
jgi:hypothetical protein